MVGIGSERNGTTERCTWREENQDVADHAIQSSHHRNTDRVILSGREGGGCVDPVARDLAAQGCTKERVPAALVGSLKSGERSPYCLSSSASELAQKTIVDLHHAMRTLAGQQCIGAAAVFKSIIQSDGL